MKPVCLITGATAGIGAALSRRLASTYRLVLVGRRAQRLQELEAELSQHGAEAYGISADLSQADSSAQVIAQSVSHYGRLDVLINNAGTMSLAACGAYDDDHITSQLDINLLAPLRLTNAALPQLREHKGHIITVSSIAAAASFASCGVYSASKAAIETWSRCLREELRDAGVRVGVIVPGATVSEIWPADCDFDQSRMCRAEDVAESIAHMLSCPASASVDRIEITPPGGPF